MSSEVVRPCRSVSGSITVPGDKSISHRAVMLGAVAEGRTVVRNFLSSADCLATAGMFGAMGVRIEHTPEAAVIDGHGPLALREPDDVLQAGNSGTTMRLMLGLLAGLDIYAVLTGDASLRRRPMDRVAVPLSERGASIRGRGERFLAPLSLRGRRGLGRLEYASPVASAQVKTSLLLSGLWATGATTLSEPFRSRDHGERMLAAFGADIQTIDGKIILHPGRDLQGREIDVPGDISSAAFFMVLAAAVEGAELRICGVGVNPTRDGIVEVLQEMGASLSLEECREAGGEPVADIIVRGGRLTGVTIGAELMPRLIDEIPVLAVAAAVAEGRTIIRDASELRVKESDRISSVCRMLSCFGVEATETEDGMTIEGGALAGGAEVDSHGDHRVAMAAAVAASLATGPATIRHTSCIDTSFPGFFSLLREVTSLD